MGRHKETNLVIPLPYCQTGVEWQLVPPRMTVKGFLNALKFEAEELLSYYADGKDWLAEISLVSGKKGGRCLCCTRTHQQCNKACFCS